MPNRTGDGGWRRLRGRGPLAQAGCHPSPCASLPCKRNAPAGACSVVGVVWCMTETETAAGAAFAGGARSHSRWLGAIGPEGDVQKERPRTDAGAFNMSGCGSRIRTCDLRVMSPTSYRTAPSRVWYGAHYTRTGPFVIPSRPANRRQGGDSGQAPVRRGYLTRVPGVAPSSGERMCRSEPPEPAASTMPSERPNFILRGARLATITVCRPTREAGS